MSTALAIRDEPHYMEVVREIRALAERIEHVQDAKKLVDRARIAQIWAERQRLGEEKVRLAIATRFWALRREGQLLAEMRERGELLKGRPEKASSTTRLSTLKIGYDESSRAQKLAEIPADDFAAAVEEAAAAGRVTYSELRRRADRSERERKTREHESKLLKQLNAGGGPTSRIEVADLRSFDPGPVDAIVTDPPYVTADALELYAQLGAFAAHHLRPGGLLAIFAWQPILPGVFAALDRPELVYRWTVAWLSGAHETTADHARRVYDGWKPIVVYWRAPADDQAPMLTDVVRSGRDTEKGEHRWQQTLEGSRQLVRATSRVGDRVCDPFLGAGTTALAALAEDRHFVGCDIDEAAVTLAKRRLAR